MRAAAATPVALLAALGATHASAQTPVSGGAPALQGGGASPAPVPSADPPAAPVEPSVAAAGFAARRDVACADFRPGPGATWKALASVSFPGPQGPVRVTAGQVISPGAYVAGLDLAAILQARCL